MPESAKMTEEQVVGLVRSALIVAGQEMGSDGDHWPVIKSTIHNIMKDWEDLQTERDICVEVKKHYDKLVLDLQTLSDKVSEPAKTDIQETAGRIQHLIDACFSKVNGSALYFTEEDVPAHVKRAEAIIKTLGGADDV